MSWLETLVQMGEMKMGASTQERAAAASYLGLEARIYLFVQEMKKAQETAEEPIIIGEGWERMLIMVARAYCKANGVSPDDLDFVESASSILQWLCEKLGQKVIIAIYMNTGVYG
jgi:hypothetical protein